MPMSAATLETPIDLRTRLSGVLEAPGKSDDVEPWELHSELVLVCPEVCKRALEELPERDPDAFMSRPPSVADTSVSEREAAPPFGQALFVYTLWRFGQTARFGLLTIGTLVAVAYLAELLR
jgi:hypothetical protein